MTLRSTFAADLAAARRQKSGRLVPFLFPNVFAVAMYRLASALRTRGAVRTARLATVVAHVLTGAEIDPQAVIGAGLFLEHTTGVVVGPGVVAGRNVVLGAAVLLGSRPESQSRPRTGFPMLGDNVTVWSKASIIGPVRVGDYAIIGAHALVLDDVPPNTVARGIPARMFPNTLLRGRDTVRVPQGD